MAGLPPFDMFKQEFTESSVNNFIILIADKEDEIMKELRGAEYMDLNINAYNSAKTYLKKYVTNISNDFDIFSQAHMEFLVQQEKTLYNVLGMEHKGYDHFSKFAGVFPHESEIIEIITRFKRECRELSNEIENMSGYENLTANMYEGYKTMAVNQIVAINTTIRMYVNMIRMQHASTEKYIKKKAELGALANTIPNTTNVALLYCEIKNVELLASLEKAVHKFRKFSGRVHLMLDDAIKLSDELHPIEVAVCAMRLKGMVDLQSINKHDLDDQIEAKLDSLTKEIYLIVSKWKALLEEESHVLKLLELQYRNHQ